MCGKELTVSDYKRFFKNKEFDKGICQILSTKEIGAALLLFCK
ncbi:hypothetical protein ACFOG5_08570 [Pedobacter fastidiosus]